MVTGYCVLLFTGVKEESAAAASAADRAAVPPTAPPLEYGEVEEEDLRGMADTLHSVLNRLKEKRRDAERPEDISVSIQIGH